MCVIYISIFIAFIFRYLWLMWVWGLLKNISIISDNKNLENNLTPPKNAGNISLMFFRLEQRLHVDISRLRSSKKLNRCRTAACMLPGRRNPGQWTILLLIFWDNGTNWRHGHVICCYQIQSSLSGFFIRLREQEENVQTTKTTEGSVGLPEIHSGRLKAGKLFSNFALKKTFQHHLTFLHIFNDMLHPRPPLVPPSKPCEYVFLEKVEENHFPITDLVLRC